MGGPDLEGADIDLGQFSGEVGARRADFTGHIPLAMGRSGDLHRTNAERP